MNNIDGDRGHMTKMTTDFCAVQQMTLLRLEKIGWWTWSREQLHFHLANCSVAYNCNFSEAGLFSPYLHNFTFYATNLKFSWNYTLIDVYILMSAISRYTCCIRLFCHVIFVRLSFKSRYLYLKWLIWVCHDYKTLKHKLV